MNDFPLRLFRLFVRLLVHPVTLLVVAFLSGLVAFALLAAIPGYQAKVARVEGLQPISVASLNDRAPGSEVLLQGQIDAATPAVHQQFVAYVYEEYRDDSFDGSSNQHWVESSRATPPLLITLPDGVARVSNDDYAFDNTAATVREAEPTLTKGALQSRGYRVGDPVLIVGKVVDAGASPSVAAEWVYAGTRASYLDEYRRVARESLPLGVPFLIVFVVSAAGLAWQIRRVVRETAAEHAAQDALDAQQAAVAATMKARQKRAVRKRLSDM